MRVRREQSESPSGSEIGFALARGEGVAWGATTADLAWCDRVELRLLSDRERLLFDRLSVFAW